MNAVEFSTRLAAWCAKYPNQHIAAAELGASYGTLTGWLGGRMPCALTRAAVLRRIEGGTMDPVHAVSAAELAAACRMWRGRHGLSQIQAAELLGLPRETIRSVEAMGHEPKPLFSDEILHRMGQPVDAEVLAEVKRRERPVEPAVLAAALRKWPRNYGPIRSPSTSASNCI